MKDAEPRFGAKLVEGGIRFSVWSAMANRLWASIFDDSGQREIHRIELEPEGEGVHAAFAPGLPEGTRYGFRADGDYEPERGLWFDPDKLLIDPYARAIDRPFVYDPRLAARRGQGGDTAPLMPKSVAVALPFMRKVKTPLFEPGGLIYEVPVKAFTILHPEVPEEQRGTVSALAHPAVIDHLRRLGVSAVELMPVAAWIDERHLPPLGLTNAWGYNPVSFMAPDPRLAPGGMSELRSTVEALHAVGIGVILDVVFNHTGESDELGPTLSLRGLDNQAYYRHFPGNPGRLVNDTGTGNTLACIHPIVQELVLDSLRHFVLHAGIDGFRFDLAPVLGRGRRAYDPKSPLFSAMRKDPVLKDRILIAEPWDIGAGGYQLGNFPGGFLEWNDKYRDDVRRFWRGDRGMIGQLATRLAGSSDVFRHHNRHQTRTVNFVAAHDGMTLADITRFERKHNEANGEQNHDGHNENLSWNNGVEGETRDSKILDQRRHDVKALLATLFASRGTIQLTAGDEFGRTQEGNNNAYAQDNAVTWLDWAHRDPELETYVAALSALRRGSPALRDTGFLTGTPSAANAPSDVEWLTEAGRPLAEQDWQDGERRRLAMVLGDGAVNGGRLAVLVNGGRRQCSFSLPTRDGYRWEVAVKGGEPTAGPVIVPGRTVVFVAEEMADAG